MAGMAHMSVQEYRALTEHTPVGRRATKYGNRKTEVNGVVFDSKREADRYAELMAMLKRGDISNLKLQPEYTLQEGFTEPDGTKVRPVRYRADFSYTDANGMTVIEDAKGVRTKEYLLKRKLMADRGLYIVEV